MKLRKLLSAVLLTVFLVSATPTHAQETLASERRAELLYQIEALLALISHLQAQLETKQREVLYYKHTSILRVNEDDHVEGSANAPITMITYTDFECPFCKVFHETRSQILEEYGASGEVRWVYRNFPLGTLHPNASQIAATAECVADKGGNEAYWKFVDLVFGERETNQFTEISRLEEFANRAGISDLQYAGCDDEKYLSLVRADFDEIIENDGQGTPHTIFIAGDETGEILGAQPIDVVRGIIKNILQQSQ